MLENTLHYKKCRQLSTNKQFFFSNRKLKRERNDFNFSFVFALISCQIYSVVADFTPSQTFTGYDGQVICLAFGSNGFLANGSTDLTIKLWDMTTGTLLRILTDHESWVNSVAFNSKNILASCSDDKIIKLWDTTTGNLLRTITAHSGSVWSVAFSSHGILASGSSVKTIKLWDIGFLFKYHRCFFHHKLLVSFILFHSQ